jgi:hypothetical protein
MRLDMPHRRHNSDARALLSGLSLVNADLDSDSLSRLAMHARLDFPFPRTLLYEKAEKR